MSDRITANAVLHPRPDLTCHVPRASRLRYSISEKCNEVPEGRRRDPHGSPKGNGRRKENEKRASPPAWWAAPARRRQEFDLPRTERFVLCPIFSAERF